MTRALILGCNGQDGSYLSELLLLKGYEVHGLVRRNSSGYPNIEHLKDKISIHYGDICTDNHLCYLINDLKPDEVYNLAAQSDVGISFECPEYTGDTTGLGVLRILEAIKHFSPNSKFYQASTSELFGIAPAPQNELSPMNPQSPYAIAKLYGYHAVKVYRQSYGLFACNGILFNHESPRRGLNFVTRKVTQAVANIAMGNQIDLKMGNLEARRDWGYAPDFVKAMWLMLQQDKPDDYVIGTGQTHSVLDLVGLAFGMVGLDYEDYVKVSDEYKRPSEVHLLQADATKAHDVLGWYPSINFKELISIMLQHDLKGAKEVAKV